MQRGLPLLPLYTEEAGGTVFTSADTWPGNGGALGLTKAGIADAKAKGVKPTGGVGESRAVMIEGPSHEAIELIEIR